MPQKTGIPVLDFAAEPGGAPPPVLCGKSAGNLAQLPSSNETVLILHRRSDVLRTLTDASHFAMAGVTPAGDLRGCPLTGAEMQSPDGGLLSMNMPALRDYRRRLNPLFTPRAVQKQNVMSHALAYTIARSMRGRRTADAIADFAEPFTAQAVSHTMGTPREDWDQILGFSQVAFAVVPSAAAVSKVAAAWEDLYRYYGPIAARKRRHPDGTLIAQVVGALDGFTPSQVIHAVATISNGFGAVLPVLAICLTELLQHPSMTAACLSGERTWDGTVDHLLSTRAMFPIALPRIALRDTELSSGRIPEGTVVLPSLIAAAHDPELPVSSTIPFGAGPHFCPGAALTRIWASRAMESFFTAFPRMKLAGNLDWQAGTLSIPREITVRLNS